LSIIKHGNHRILLIDIVPNTNIYKLLDSNILVESETVTSDISILTRDIDYLIDYKSGVITLLSDNLTISQLSISYFVIPDYLLNKYYLYQMKDVKDSLDTITKLRKNPFSLQNDSKLIISGSKTFSLTFSNQDSYDIKQSLFIKLEGELNDNIKIEGQLSDSQSPLSPDGDSRELSNIDQVYLKLFSDSYALIFGNQDWEFNQTQLMNYKFKFEGVNAWYKDKFAIQGAIASNSGNRETNRITGVEGKQGPYYLSAKTTGQTVQIIPGSESVSINGSIISRGSDYYIDYSEGSLTFNVLITSNSTIIVNFQYTDDYYSQNMYITSSEVPLASNLKLRHHLIWQKDNKNNSLLWSLSKADKDSLANAGDNDVHGQGVFEVSAESGNYKKLYDINNHEYYQYSPNDSTAIYLVYFSFVGLGNGDYEHLTTTAYKYVGIGMGSYLPFKSLVAPKDVSNLSLGLQYQSDKFEVNVEGMFTNQDKNTFSSIDDNDNQSIVTKSTIKLSDESISINPIITLSYFFKQKHSYTFANLNSIQDMYEFSNIDDADSISQNQLDLSVNMSTDNSWKQFILFRYNTMNDYLVQKAIKFDTYIKQNKYSPMLSWYGVYSNQDYIHDFNIDNNTHYHKLQSEWKWHWVTLYYNYLLQKNLYYPKDITPVSLLGNSFIQSNPAIKLSNDKSISSTFSYSAEENSIKQNKKWSATKESETWKTAQMFNSDINSFDLNLTHRIVNNLTSESEGKQLYDLLNAKSNHQWFSNSISANTAYQLNQIEFFPKIRELQYVGNGAGQYDSTGVIVTDGDYDYFYVNSGTGKMSTEINASLNLYFHLAKKYNWHPLWDRFHLDSGFQITENTLQRNNLRLYLLFPEEIYNENSTLYGRQSMNHSLWADVWSNVLSSNLRYESSKTLDNRYEMTDRTYSENKEIELTWKNVYGGQLRTSYQNRYDKNSRYNSVITSDLISNLYYRNFSSQINTQTVLAFSQEQGKNQAQSDSYVINFIKVNPSMVLFYQNKYRFSSSVTAQYNKRSGSDFLTYLPEKRNGYLFLWSLQAQYKLTSYSSGSIEYSGKSYPNDESIHELKMEFKAEL
jgi:hypothetical protein